MKKFSQKEAEAFIINYMIAHHYVGHKQTTFDNVVRHVPSADQKVVKHALEELMRKGFLSSKRKHYGIHISLLIHKLDEVKEYVKDLERHE